MSLGSFSAPENEQSPFASFRKEVLWFTKEVEDEGHFFGGERFLSWGHGALAQGLVEFMIALDPTLEITESTFLGFALREVHKG